MAFGSLNFAILTRDELLRKGVGSFRVRTGAATGCELFWCWLAHSEICEQLLT